MIEAQEQIRFLAMLLAELHTGEDAPHNNQTYWIHLSKDKTVRTNFYASNLRKGNQKQVEYTATGLKFEGC